jgi:hypothetical protein
VWSSSCSKNCSWFLVGNSSPEPECSGDDACMYIVHWIKTLPTDKGGKKRTSMLQGTQLIHNFCKSMISICLLLVQSYSLQVTTGFEQSVLGFLSSMESDLEQPGGESNPSSKLLLWTTTLLAGT